MHAPRLDPLFNPSSVAVVGASPNTTYSARFIENLLEYGYTGDLYLVNPSRDEAFDRPCYDSLDDLPTVVDLAAIIVPRRYVLDTIHEAGELGVPAALIITAGFGEADDTGRELEDELAQAADEYGIRICGPNSIGLASGHDNAVLTSTCSRPVPPGRLSLVSQSGALAFITFFERAADEEIEFGRIVSTGNEADLSLSDYIAYFVEDPDTAAVCAYIEGLTDPDRFMTVAETATREGTPVVAIKVGRSDMGAAAALSHTGSVTGNDDAWDAAFAQTGVQRVNDIPDMLAAASAHAHYDPPESNRVCIASTSGGLASLLADTAVQRGLDVPDLAQETEQTLLDMEELLTFGELHNPIDIRGYGAEILPDIADVLFADDQYDAYVFAIGLPGIDERAQRITDHLITIADQATQPVLVLWTGRKEPADLPDPQPYEQLRDHLPVYYDPGTCLDALASLVRFDTARTRLNAQPPRTTLQETTKPTPPADRPPDTVLSWTDAEALLAAYDIPVTTTHLTTTAEDAIATADDLGYPVVLKLDSPDIPHRTDIDAVRTDLTTPTAVRTAYEEIIDNATTHDPDARIEGVLVQPHTPDGTEVLAGVTHDPIFGPIVTVGPGGELVELHTPAVRIPPFAPEEARRAIDDTILADLLAGYRGQPPGDTDALTSLLVNLGQLARTEPVAELDLNPIIVTPDGATALDILIRTSPDPARSYRRSNI